MLNDYRRLQPVKLDYIGVERGQERYCPESGAGQNRGPSVAKWRNNLTALSARHNLFFVAQKETVAVFEPSIHSHSLGQCPCLRIEPVMANPDVPGYLDLFTPHCINHLIVGDLGSKEVLFLSTDSGNVVAYFTSVIRRVIARASCQGRAAAKAGPYMLRPFFTHWVYESAWGLSIHKNARMLAVSANVPQNHPVSSMATVTVFAFALVESHEPKNANEPADDLFSDNEDPEVEAGEPASVGAYESEWNFWVADPKHPSKMPDRSFNWKTRLVQHKSNIPSISFVNADEDLDGEYLLSTDIAGVSKLWHIWQGQTVSSWSASGDQDGSYNRFNTPRTSMGWAVLSLDPHCFEIVDTWEEYCGVPDMMWFPGQPFSIESSLMRIPGHDSSVTSLEYLRRVASVGPSEDEGDMNEDDYGGDEDGEDEEEDGDRDDSSSGSGRAPSDQEIPTAQATLESNRDDDIVDQARLADIILSFSSDEQDDFDREDPSDADDEYQRTLHTEVTDGGTVLPDQGRPDQWSPSTFFADPEDTNYSSGSNVDRTSEWAESTHSGHFKPRRLQTTSRAASGGQPNIPSLHLTSTGLRFFDGDGSRECLTTLPHVLAFPRRQNYGTNHGIDRLNMTQYIPELGLVVIASQIGRAAVCSLTRRRSSGLLGMRIDWILPFEEQERTRHRPTTFLLGMAAGPIPAHQPDSPRSRSSPSDESDFEEGENYNKPDEATFQPPRWKNQPLSSVYLDREMKHSALLSASTRITTSRNSCTDLSVDDFKRSLGPSSGSSSPSSNSLSGSTDSSCNSKKRPDQRRCATPSRRNSTSCNTRTEQADRYLSGSSPTSRDATLNAHKCKRKWIQHRRARNTEEPWLGINYSRCYRLMLYYADHTVMTYELSRQRPFLGDPVTGRRNWRNQDEEL